MIILEYIKRINSFRNIRIVSFLSAMALILTGCGDGGKGNFKKGLELHNVGKYQEASKYFQKGGLEGMAYMGMYWYRGLTKENKRSFEEAHRMIGHGVYTDADLALCRGHVKLISNCVGPDFGWITFASLSSALDCYKQAKELGYTRSFLNEDIDVPLDDIIKVLQGLENLSPAEKKLKHRSGGTETYIGPIVDNWGPEKKNGWGVIRNNRNFDMLIGYWIEGELQSPYIAVSRNSDQVFYVKVY